MILEKTFLDKIRALGCWKNGKNDLLTDFQEDTELLWATLYSIVEFSCVTPEARDEAMAELKDFARSSKISPQRQHELIRKVQIANWDARDSVREMGVHAFIDDFVNICLQDKKIQPAEYKLIYLIGKYLNLSKSQISGMLRTRLLKLRYRAILFFERPWVSNLITFLIVLNAIQFGLMTCSWFDPYKGPWFYRLDFAFNCLFTIEILCRIFAFRKDFFRESQNIFDFVIIAIAWIPAPGFQWLSAFRVFRAMLLFNRLGQLKLIMKSLLDALPNIGWVTVLLFIFYYVFAVLTTNLFGREFNAFHSIENSFFSLFQLMTLEGWPDLVSSVMVKYPYAWLVFIPFMLITSYVFLNLVIGIIVTAMRDISLKKNSIEKKEIDEIRELKERLQDMSQQMSEIQKMLDCMHKK